MGKICCVPWCNNGQVGGITALFKFPKEDLTRKKWIDFVSGGTDWKPTTTSYICSDHFAKEMLIHRKNRIDRKKDAYPGKYFFLVMAYICYLYINKLYIECKDSNSVIVCWPKYPAPYLHFLKLALTHLSG